MKKLASLCFVFAFLLSQTFLFARDYQNSSNNSKDKNFSEEISVEKSLNSYPAKFIEISKNSISLAEKENFSAAINVFFEADNNGKIALSFNAENYSSGAKINTQEIQEILNDVKIQSEKYKTLQNEISEIKMNFSQIMNFSSYENTLLKFIEIHNKILTDGLELKKFKNDIYVLSLTRFILGVKENEKTGIIGIINWQWKNLLNSYEKILKTECKNQIKLFNDYFKNLNFLKQNLSKPQNQNNQNFSAEKSFEKIQEIVKLMQKINSLNEKFLLENGKTFASENSEFDSSLKNVLALCDEGKNLTDFINELKKFQSENFRKPENSIANIRSENQNYTESLFENAKKFAEAKNQATFMKRSTNLRELQNVKNENAQWNFFVDFWIFICSELENFCEEKSKFFWIESANFYSDNSKKILDENNKIYEESFLLISNSEKSYAKKCFNQTSKLKETILKDIQILILGKNQLNTVTNKNAWFKNQFEIINLSITELLNLEKKCDSLLEKSKSKLNLSQSVKNEIDIFYNRAVKFYEQKNFIKANENLTRTKSIYQQKNQELKNDFEIQNETYTKIENLRNKIIEMQEPVYFSELNNLKNLARSSYYDGNFEKANMYISQIDTKREQWASLIDREIEEDQSLEQLRDFINTAQAIKEGREFQDYDAKAPEMKQNFSIANYYFEKGKSFFESGNKKEAEECFNLASKKINQIKIYYPRNKDASNLALKIEQILNKENFEQSFATRVKSLSETNFSEKNIVAQENYNNLLDLDELNPNYPGLKNILVEAEIALGLRQKIIPDSKIKRSLEISNDAKKILENAGRDSFKLEQAKKLALQSIELNPENNNALTILDEISFRTGNRSAVVLSVQEEELYNSAVKFLQEGKIFNARENLNKLLENPANLNSAKIQKLKRRLSQ